MNDFIAKKREIFLVQMSLDTKRAEITKLEERALQVRHPFSASMVHPPCKSRVIKGSHTPYRKPRCTFGFCLYNVYTALCSFSRFLFIVRPA